VSPDLLFDLFQDGEDGRLWRGSFADLGMAKRNAQRFADEERQEFSVYTSEDYSEVARVFPSRSKLTPDTGPDRNILTAGKDSDQETFQDGGQHESQESLS
jgi:hypothetical protein